MRSRIHSIGIDRGRTWIRAMAFDSKGRRVRFLKTAAPTLEELPSFLKRHFRSWKARPHHLGVATQGVWTPRERARLKKSLRSLATRVTVISDAEGAWRAAFGEPRHGRAAFRNQEGILVNSGTGSIALARDRRGRLIRRGGLGPILGDEGSAFWIGRAWLKVKNGDAAPAGLLNLVRSDQPARRIAALAPGVLRRAQRGDRAAQRITQEAQGHLARLVITLAKATRSARTIPVSWAGSVLGNPWFRRGFLKTLQKEGVRTGRRYLLTPPHCDIATAVALYAN